MIAFKYTKCDGAEYISHLDTLRHIDRTLRRAHIKVKKSEGFNKHPRIYMNNPTATGVISLAEYCSVDCVFDGDFASAFNACSPRGIKCIGWRKTDTNANYANTITRCSYFADFTADFAPEEILGETSIVVTDLRGRRTDIRPRIYSIERDGDRLTFTLGSGDFNLRPDLFAKYLCGRYGGSAGVITKTESFGENVF